MLQHSEHLLVLLNTYHDARHQTLVDPADLNDWSFHLILDLAKSNERRNPILRLESLAAI